MKDTVTELLQSALATLQSEGILPADASFRPQVGNTKDKSHGDYACNIALMAAKAAGCPPRKLAEALIERLPASAAVDKVEIAGPGFINFFMSTASAFGVVNTILEQASEFGRNNTGEGESLQVEFVSANPTGPLHVGHGALDVSPQEKRTDLHGVQNCTHPFSCAAAQPPTPASARNFLSDWMLCVRNRPSRNRA